MNPIFKKPAICTLFLLLAIPAFAAYQPIDTVIATAGNDVITQSDLDRKVTIVKQNFAAQNRPVPSEQEIRKQVLDKLIIESLQLQLAEQSGLRVSDEQLNMAIGRIADRQKITEAQLREKLEQEGMSYTDMREQIRRDITLQQLQQSRLRHKIQITEQEVENFLASAEGKKLTASSYKVSYLVLELPETADNKEAERARQTMVDIRKDLNAGRLDFNAVQNGQLINGYKVSGARLEWMDKDNLPTLFAQAASHLQKGGISKPLRSGAGWHLVQLDDIAGGSAEIVHQMLARHILIKPSEVRSEEQTRLLARSLHERLLKGDDFTLLAKEYSEDKGSALQGGSLGWSKPSQYVPEFAKTLEQLRKNEISQPIQTEFGWHIVQKLDERDHDMTLENQKNQAYQAIYERKFTEELEAWLVTLREESFVEIKKVQD